MIAKTLYQMSGVVILFAILEANHQKIVTRLLLKFLVIDRIPAGSYLGVRSSAEIMSRYRQKIQDDLSYVTKFLLIRQ